MCDASLPSLGAAPSALPEDMTKGYSSYIVAFSGGKDSLACALHLIDIGVPKDRIELWHHDVDGREGSELMDWPCTKDYCAKVAEALGLRLFYSWKVGGFEREMLRKNTPAAPTKFEAVPYRGADWVKVDQIGGKGPPNTRRLFPQVSPDLSVRWCSAYLKIDVGSSAIRNQERFEGARTVVVSGERAQESKARANYAVFEPDRSDNRQGRAGRHVDRWRPVHKWTEEEVWALIKKYKVNPHPCYRIGWGRCSCSACIFGSPDQWASLRVLYPKQFQRIADYEQEFGKTIDRKYSVEEKAARGIPYVAIQANPEAARSALSKTFTEPVIVSNWQLPAGAFGDSSGPT